MQEHQNSLQELLNQIFVKSPIAGFVLSYTIMGIAAFMHNIPGIWDLEIPKIIMQLIQLGLGTGGFLIGFATFKKNFKNKNKK